MEGLEPLGKLEEIGRLKIDGDVIQIGSVKFYGNRVTFDQKTTLEEGRIAGIWVQRQHKTNLWALGDWALGMESKFGEEAAQYVSSEHFSEAFLRRARWVCDKIAPSRRMAKLSFEHHAAVATLEAAEQDKWLRKAIEKELSVQDLRRAIRKKTHKDRYIEQDLPAGRYRVFYVDPPWQYNDSGVITDNDAYGRAERHFPTMSLDKIKELPVKEMIARNSALFLWVTVPLLPDAFEVIAAWGFIYKTHYVWDKQAHNPGHYSSVQHELLLLATHGKMVPDYEVAQTIKSVQAYARPGEHSQKPEEFRHMIDTLYPSVTRTKNDRVELFARYQADGWDQWGNEQLQDAKAAAAGDDTNAPDASDDNPVEADQEQAGRRLRAV
jgi:N6-adenosine-specific RNA methylase IME4